MYQTHLPRGVGQRPRARMGRGTILWTLRKKKKSFSSRCVQQGASEEDKHAMAEYMQQSYWEKLELMEKWRAEMKVKSCIGSVFAACATKELTNWSGYRNGSADTLSKYDYATCNLPFTHHSPVLNSARGLECFHGNIFLIFSTRVWPCIAWDEQARAIWKTYLGQV